MCNLEEFTEENNPNYFKLWELKSTQEWYKYKIYAKTTKDFEMHVWNGKHPVESNTTKYICNAGTKVIIWMVSRFGDVGITDDLIDPIGYNARGVNADLDLTDYEFKKI